jgi:hypothetical protein
MKRSLIMVRDGMDGLRLYAPEQWELEEFEKLPRAKAIMVDIATARNVKQLRLYWAVAAKAADHYEAWHDQYDADWYARCSMPWMTREIILANDKVSIKPKSIALQSMSKEEFTRFFDRAVFLWSKKIGCDPLTLLDQAA